MRLLARYLLTVHNSTATRILMICIEPWTHVGEVTLLINLVR